MKKLAVSCSLGAAALCSVLAQGDAPKGSDRLDMLSPDGKIVGAVMADSVKEMKFRRAVGGYDKIRVYLRNGSERQFPLKDVANVARVPYNAETEFSVSCDADYHSFLRSSPSGKAGEAMMFDSSDWYTHGKIHIIGDYTGTDYSATPGFIRLDAMPDCYCAAWYSFIMPFEPITIRQREYYPELYNGIPMPEVWPPVSVSHTSHAPMNVPYLAERMPKAINVSVGRQLFVDDFLIESTTLERVWHKPVKYAGNPVLKAEAGDMTTKIPGASAKDGGVWWEPRENYYKMWYEAGWLGKIALATSTDGLVWSRPDLGNGSNIISSLSDMVCNSSSVVLDYDAPDAERYKMFVRPPNANADNSRGYAMVSPDGVKWTNRTPTGRCGDKSTMFYNPFRRRWVFSLRSLDVAAEPWGRARYYVEHPDFLTGAQWEDSIPVFWCQSDELDLPDPAFGNRTPQLYNLNAVAYESVMLGMHQLLMDENEDAKAAGRPKTTDLHVAFSRDGFHWDRPLREPFIASSRTAGSWDRGYVQSVGGVCAVTPDSLLFYYIGFAGGKESVLHANGATGVATLRRDGFASMSTQQPEASSPTSDGPKSTGTLLTRVLTLNEDAIDCIYRTEEYQESSIFVPSPSGEEFYLFVNADCPQGELRCEILTPAGEPIGELTAANCVPLASNTTCAALSWNIGGTSTMNIAPLLKPHLKSGFRLRFTLTEGSLYSFWITPYAGGASSGFVGAGGKTYSSNRDRQMVGENN